MSIAVLANCLPMILQYSHCAADDIAVLLLCSDAKWNRGHLEAEAPAQSPGPLAYSVFSAVDTDYRRAKRLQGSNRIGRARSSSVRDPRFAEKVADIVGLYLAPPGSAVVLSIDEKTQVQALDRTQPLLPIDFGVTEKRTHDYIRHGTTNLFAALQVGSGANLRRMHTRSVTAHNSRPSSKLR